MYLQAFYFDRKLFDVEKVCGDPGTPVKAVLDHANSDVGDYAFMSIQRYNCYTGYAVISGSLQIECTQDGTWNDTVPICDGN